MGIVATGEDKIVDVEDKKVKQAINMEDVKVGVGQGSREALLLEEGINSLIPCTGGLFQAIESFLKATNHCRGVWINETGRLINVDPPHQDDH